MTSSSPFPIECPARPPSPLGKGQSDFPFLPGSPPPSGTGFNPFLTLELPLAPRKGYSDHPAHTSGPSPNPGRRGSDSPYPPSSPHFSREPFAGLACNPGISSVTSTPLSPPRPISSPPPSSHSQPPLRLARCSFEPCSPLLVRHCCREPVSSGSPPQSPCPDRFGLLGSPPLPSPGSYGRWISPATTSRPCAGSPYLDHHSYLCYCPENPSALIASPVTSPVTHQPPPTSPVTSPALTRVHWETGPMISPTVTCSSQGTGLLISPPLAHRPMETRPIISPPLTHRVLEISQISLHPPRSSGRSCNDPPLSSASSPPTGQFYQGHLKPTDSCEPKPQLDPPFGENRDSPLSSEAGTAGCSSSPQEGSCDCSHLPAEANISAAEGRYCIFRLPPGITGSCSSQSQVPSNPCSESIFTWETGGSSYLFSGATVSGPSCSQEPLLPLSSHCPYSAFPLPQGNQFISPPQSTPCRSYNKPPILTPVCPQEKSPKSPELEQPRALHRCHSLITPAQNIPPDQPRPPKVRTSPPPPSHPSGLSGPSCMVTSITTCPKELPQGTTLPILVPRTLKTVIPTSFPLHLPCDPVLPSIYTESRPCGSLPEAPCSTHIYSVVPPTPNPCPPSGSIGTPQCHNQPMVPPCGTCGISKGPLQPHRQPVAPPCSTHIYSFIPLRTPFDPQSLPIGPRPRGHPDTMPCGLHVYSVASRGSRKESPQIPYSCPLPSSMICSTNPSCSSPIINECQSSDSQNTNIHENKSQSQSESPHLSSQSWSKSKSLHRSRSNSPHQRSNSPHQSINQDQCESLQLGIYQGQTESLHSSKSKSSLHRKSRSQSKSPCHGKSLGKSESSRHSRSHGQNKSPCHNKWGPEQEF